MLELDSLFHKNKNERQGFASLSAPTKVKKKY